MLYIVLVLVLAALGLLVTALITASSLWAWVSIGLSVLAGLILIVDWMRRRRRSADQAAEAAEPEPAAPEPAVPNPAVSNPAVSNAAVSEPAVPDDPVTEEQTALIPAAGELGDPADTPEPELPAESEPEETTAVVAAVEPETSPIPEAAPGEERTAPADIATVSELDDEVVVVDEFPRYHLTDCGWLGPRDPIPIAVGEARQLGFTPCARCTPDAALVAAHSRKSKADN